MAACGKCDGESPQIALIKPATYAKLHFFKGYFRCKTIFALK